MAWMIFWIRIVDLAVLESFVGAQEHRFRDSARLKSSKAIPLKCGFVFGRVPYIAYRLVSIRTGQNAAVT